MTARERLQLLVGEFSEEQAERALQLLSSLSKPDARPWRRVGQLPAFVGIGDSGHGDISEHADDLSQEASASSPAYAVLIDADLLCGCQPSSAIDTSRPPRFGVN
jgi:hypothetical protein